MSDIIRELREDYPAVDVTTVVFSRDFAGVGCCVIPQDRVLAIIDDIDLMRKQLEIAVTALRRIGSLAEKNVPKYAKEIASEGLRYPVSGAKEP